MDTDSVESEKLKCKILTIFNKFIYNDGLKLSNGPKLHQSNSGVISCPVGERLAVVVVRGDPDLAAVQVLLPVIPSTGVLAQPRVGASGLRVPAAAERQPGPLCLRWTCPTAGPRVLRTSVSSCPSVLVSVLLLLVPLLMLVSRHLGQGGCESQGEVDPLGLTLRVVERGQAPAGSSGILLHAIREELPDEFGRDTGIAAPGSNYPIDGPWPVLVGMVLPDELNLVEGRHHEAMECFAHYYVLPGNQITHVVPFQLVLSVIFLQVFFGKHV